jgi:hypothetical protein
MAASCYSNSLLPDWVPALRLSREQDKTFRRLQTGYPEKKPPADRDHTRSKARQTAPAAATRFRLAIASAFVLNLALLSSPPQRAGAGTAFFVKHQKNSLASQKFLYSFL